MKTIILVFVITVLFLVGVTKFTNDTNFNEAVRYASLSNYYNSINKISFNYEDEEEFEEENLQVEVSFKGAVNSEKKISIKVGSYLSSALIEVGGLASDADTRCINDYYVILEPMEFYIPRGKDMEKVSINTALEVELMSLPSIGSTIASRIVDYRKTNGNYGCLEDLLNVKGVGNATFDKFKDYIIL